LNIPSLVVVFFGSYPPRRTLYSFVIAFDRLISIIVLFSKELVYEEREKRSVNIVDKHRLDDRSYKKR